MCQLKQPVDFAIKARAANVYADHFLRFHKCNYVKLLQYFGDNVLFPTVQFYIQPGAYWLVSCVRVVMVGISRGKAVNVKQTVQTSVNDTSLLYSQTFPLCLLQSQMLNYTLLILSLSALVYNHLYYCYFVYILCNCLFVHAWELRLFSILLVQRSLPMAMFFIHLSDPQTLHAAHFISIRICDPLNHSLVNVVCGFILHARCVHKTLAFTELPLISYLIKECDIFASISNLLYLTN